MDISTQTYTIEGMDCAHCALEVEEAVAKLAGVKTVQVNFATGKMKLNGAVDFPKLQAQVAAVGKRVVAPDAAPAPAVTRRGGLLGFWDYLLVRTETQLALIGGVLILLTLVLTFVGLPELFANTLYTIGLLITLYPIARSGLNTLRINHSFNINLLMCIAAIGALYIGEYLEAATVIFLFAVGEALEGYTADRARDSLRALVALKPRQALRLRGLNETLVSVDELALGDFVVIKAGEHVPMDGEVVSGTSSVNQAPITGESIPVAKTIGDTTYAGTINGEGSLVIRVTRHAADNTLSRIIHLVEEAQNVRAPSQRLIDSFAHYYTPAVVVMAAAVAFLPPLLFNQPFYDVAGLHGWLYRALSMLVIACPCALVISTPVTIISAITAAARRGVLIKGGSHLEMLGAVKAFAFDKTGTLTAGRPHVLAWRSVTCTTGEPCAACDDVLALAAAVERRAAHPLAAAVVQAAHERTLDNTYATAQSVESLAGRGVRGQVDGQQVTLGSHRLFDAEFPHDAALCRMIDAAEAQGQTTMLVASGTTVQGYIALADTPRPDSQRVIAALRAFGLPTVMLTGDNTAAAQAIGAAVGVDEVRAELLPEQKFAAVQELERRYGHVAMVGDGVNDTPSLAAASVGIAMGGAGSPQALETADMALMGDDLAQLPFAVGLSRFARRLIRQNVILSFGLKAVLLVLALFGFTSLWVAIFADVGMALIVTLNGMRPLKYQPTPNL